MFSDVDIDIFAWDLNITTTTASRCFGYHGYSGIPDLSQWILKVEEAEDDSRILADNDKSGMQKTGPVNKCEEFDHVSSVKEIKTEVCDQGEQTSNRPLLEGPVKQFNCDMCTKVCKSRGGLTLHKRQLHSGQYVEPEVFFCEICPKRFKREQGLRQHVEQTHSDVKAFSCPICSQRFKQKNSIKV